MQTQDEFRPGNRLCILAAWNLEGLDVKRAAAAEAYGGALFGKACQCLRTHETADVARAAVALVFRGGDVHAGGRTFPRQWVLWARLASRADALALQEHILASCEDARALREFILASDPRAVPAAKPKVYVDTRTLCRIAQNGDVQMASIPVASFEAVTADMVMAVRDGLTIDVSNFDAHALAALTGEAA